MLIIVQIKIPIWYIFIHVNKKKKEFSNRFSCIMVLACFIQKAKCQNPNFDGIYRKLTNCVKITKFDESLKNKKC